MTNESNKRPQPVGLRRQPHRLASLIAVSISMLVAVGYGVTLTLAAAQGDGAEVSATSSTVPIWIIDLVPQVARRQLRSARWRISRTRHRLFLDKGRLETRTTLSPTRHSFASSCAVNFIVRLTWRW